MVNDAKKMKEMKEVKEWLKERSPSSKKKINDLFRSVDMGGRIPLKEQEEALGCVPVGEVKEILKKCAIELGMIYE